MSIAEPSVTLGTRPLGRVGRGTVLAPVGVAAILLALILGTTLGAYRGNLTGFIQFGHLFALQTRPPAGAVWDSAAGYDGQFFYLQAHDPFLLHASTVARMRATADPELFRIQRLGYPLLAFLLVGGQPSALPAAMLAANVLVLLFFAGWMAAWLSRRGLSCWWALAFALAPGMWMATLRDLSDPLSTTCVIIGILAWQDRRRWTAAIALTIASLTLEVMFAIVLVLALDAAVRIWRSRAQTPLWSALRREAWPALLVPLVLFAVWQAYVITRAGTTLGTSAARAPFVAMWLEVKDTMTWGRDWGSYNLVYLGLTAAALLLTLALLRRRPLVLSLTALVFSVFVVVPSLDDPWGATRLTAPLFFTLLIDGLQRRDRVVTALCAAASLTSVLFLLAIF